MKQDMIVILDLGNTENTTLARDIRALGVYSEIYPHDITREELAALSNVKGIIVNGGPNNIVERRLKRESGFIRPIARFWRPRTQRLKTDAGRSKPGRRKKRREWNSSGILFSILVRRRKTGT